MDQQTEKFVFTILFGIVHGAIFHVIKYLSIDLKESEDGDDGSTRTFKIYHIFVYANGLVVSSLLMAPIIYFFEFWRGTIVVFSIYAFLVIFDEYAMKNYAKSLRKVYTIPFQKITNACALCNNLEESELVKKLTKGGMNAYTSIESDDYIDSDVDF